MLKKITILAAFFAALALAQDAANPLGLNSRLAVVCSRIDSARILMDQDRFEAGLDLVRAAQGPAAAPAPAPAPAPGPEPEPEAAPGEVADGRTR